MSVLLWFRIFKVSIPFNDAISILFGSDMQKSNHKCRIMNLKWLPFLLKRAHSDWGKCLKKMQNSYTRIFTQVFDVVQCVYH